MGRVGLRRHPVRDVGEILMSSLEDLMQEAAARGLTHLSVYPVHSADHKTVYWHASASPSTEKLPSKSSGMDIVEVAAQALQGMSRAPKARAGKENHGTLPIDAIPGKETEDGNITAAVKPSTMEDFLPKA